MSSAGAHEDPIRHWLSVADGEQDGEKKLAARYTAAAAARLWVLGELDGGSDEAPETWTKVRELADEADQYLDDDRQDEALYRRAQANLLALRLFEDDNDASAESDDKEPAESTS